MLKIKAEKMGELEKFGFEKTYNWYERPLQDYGWKAFASINCNDRIINYVSDFGDDVWLPDDDDDFILDLIKADMVEVCDD